MKLLLLTVLLFVASQSNRYWDMWRNQEFGQLADWAEDCDTNCTLNHTLAIPFFRGEPEAVKTMREFGYCVMTECEMVSTKGEYNEEKIREKLERTHLKQCKIEILIRNCTVKEDNATPKDIAYDLAMCLNIHKAYLAP